MSDPKDPKPPRTADQPTAVGSQGGDKRSGRVSHDSRGNPVWEWQLETGVYSRDVSTQKLKKLDLGDLSIAETAQHKRPEGLKDSPGKAERLPGGGFNPYDNSATRDTDRGSNPYDNARARGNALRPAQPPPTPGRKPADLKKLDEWIKLKKKMQGDKDQDE